MSHAGPSPAVTPSAEEFAGADLGDLRRSRRLQRIVLSLQTDPAQSFPKAAGSDAELEATYRLLRNEAVTPEAIIAPHHAMTCQRATGYETVLAVHDTTELRFPGESHREGLGRLGQKGQGFFAHVSLGVAPDQTRLPLGVLHCESLFRAHQARGKRSHRSLRDDPDNESKRWHRGVDEAERRVAGRVDLVHLMDREGDAYELLAHMRRDQRRFIVRSAHDRVVTQLAADGRTRSTVSAAAARVTAIVEREVPLSRRGAPRTPSMRRHHPPREYRVARLAFRAVTVDLVRPNQLPVTLPASLSVNVVLVQEVDPPPDQPEVSWTLLTSEPVQSAAEILRVVDWYRSRWTIEEYFKALKLGCAYEARQLESRRTLLNALAIMLPIAWRLLTLRNLARLDGDRPATTVLPRTQVDVLVATCKGRLPPAPTLRQAMLAIAGRGGHIKANGEPGWQVLGRGYHDLLLLELGWVAAQASRTDQS
jgi:hypothetical protein